MKPNFLFLAQWGFVALTFVCLFFILKGIRSTFLAMGYSTSYATKRTQVIGGILVAWLCFTSALAVSGFMGNFSIAPLNMIPALAPPLVTVLVLTFHPRAQEFIRHLPKRGLLNLQVFRVPVEIFLWWLFLANALPERMTFEGLNWDVLSGIAGPVFGFLCFAPGRQNFALATVYHVMGLGLLVNIVATGVLSLPTPFRQFFEVPGSVIMTSFPVMLLPTFLVPLAYTLHIFSLRQAALAKKATASTLGAS